MVRYVQRFSIATSLCLAIVAFAGCGTSAAVDSATLALREKYVLATPPANPTSLASAKTAVAKNPTIVVTGKIGGTELEPFESGKASFIISELPEPGESHSHTPGEVDNCPFCKRRAAKVPKAIVQFVNEKQEVLPVDARALLGVAKDQVITIQGRGELNSLDMLVITASGVYLADKPAATP